MSAVTRRFIAYGFASVHDALAAESALRVAAVSATAIPSPRALGELCGIALRIRPEDAAMAEAALAATGLPPVATAEIEDI